MSKSTWTCPDASSIIIMGRDEITQAALAARSAVGSLKREIPRYRR